METLELQTIKADVRELTDFIYDLDEFIILEDADEEEELPN